MACDTWIEKLDAYLDGELPASEARALSEHLRGCSACAAESLSRLQQKHLVPNCRPKIYARSCLSGAHSTEHRGAAAGVEELVQASCAGNGSSVGNCRRTSPYSESQPQKRATVRERVSGPARGNAGEFKSG